MKNRPAQGITNIAGVSPELAQQIAEYRSQGQLIESGHDAIESGWAKLRDVDKNGRLEPLQLPEDLRFAVVPVTSNDLYVEVWKRPRPLAPPDWNILNHQEDLEPYVMWTRSEPR